MSIGIALLTAGSTVAPSSAKEKAGFSWGHITGPDGNYTAQADPSGATVGAQGWKRNLQDSACMRDNPNSGTFRGLHLYS